MVRILPRAPHEYGLGFRVQASMKVSLYHPWIYLRGGAERTILELVRRSRHSWTIFTHHFEPDSTFGGFARLDVRELTPRISVRRSFAPLVRAAATISTARLPASDALLVSSESIGDFVLARNRLPAVCFCHTPLKILHDVHTRQALAARDPLRSTALRAMGPPFELVERRMWRRYRHIFANSNEVRDRIVQAHLAPAERVEVLYPGVDVDRFSFAGGARDEYFLVPGRIMYSKNVELALDAYRTARGQGLRSRLVVAGTVDTKSIPYLASLRKRAVGLPVDFELDVTEERMVQLMQRALAVVFPSWNEDFGIIPLEAMATGTPVIGVNSGGTRETVRDGETGWLLDPDPGSFARRLLAIEANDSPSHGMREAARRRAQQFSWDAFAQRIDDVIESVAGH